MLRHIVRVALPVLAALFTSAGSILADPCNGIQIGTHEVAGGGSSTFAQCFNAAEWGRIMVVGNGTTDLDLYVYDSFGNLVAFDEGDTDRCAVQFYVQQTQSYRVVVRNLGTSGNEFIIQAD